MLRREYPKDLEPLFIHWRHYPKTAIKIYRPYILELIGVLDGNPLDIVLPDIELTRSEVLILDFVLSQATIFRKSDMAEALAKQYVNADRDALRSVAQILNRKLERYDFKLNLDREVVRRSSVSNNKLAVDILSSTTMHREQINRILVRHLPALSRTPIASAHRLPNDPKIMEDIVTGLVAIVRGQPPTIAISGIKFTENEECVFNTLVSKPGLVTWQRLNWALDLPFGEKIRYNSMANSRIFTRMRRKLDPFDISIDAYLQRGLIITEANRQTLGKYGRINNETLIPR